MTDTAPRFSAEFPNLKLIEGSARTLERVLERQATLRWIGGVLSVIELSPGDSGSQELLRALLESIEAGQHRS